MDVTIAPSTLTGRARAPPSKSYTHRAVLSAGYGEGATIHDPLVSADTRATMRAVEAYGGTVELYSVFLEDVEDLPCRQRLVDVGLLGLLEHGTDAFELALP